MHIFSYLDVRSLSRAALVCQQWNNLASDEILWESKLKRDVETWEVVGHLSHPSLYKETMTDLTAKEMYVFIVYFIIAYGIRNSPRKIYGFNLCIHNLFTVKCHNDQNFCNLK